MCVCTFECILSPSVICESVQCSLLMPRRNSRTRLAFYCNAYTLKCEHDHIVSWFSLFSCRRFATIVLHLLSSPLFRFKESIFFTIKIDIRLCNVMFPFIHFFECDWCMSALLSIATVCVCSVYLSMKMRTFTIQCVFLRWHNFEWHECQPR